MITKQIVDRALELVQEGGGNYEYFFSQLNSPEWIEPLRERGRFSHPPDAISDGKYVRYPRWPEGEYLSRMAPMAPDAVHNALTAACFESNNHVIHQILLQIATKLPPALAANVAQHEAEWVTGQPALITLYSLTSVDLINHLAKGGEGGAALSLLGAIISVRAPAQQNDGPEPEGSDESFLWSVDPVGRIGGWEMERLVRNVSESLADSVPEGFLSLVSDELDKAILIHDNNRGNDEDWSTIRRSQIAIPNNRDLLNILVTNVQNAALLVSRKYREGYAIILRVFGRHKWPVFRRLESYALCQSVSVPMDLINKLLLDPSNYEGATKNPEFNELLRSWIDKVTKQTKGRVLDIIEAGPDLSRYSRYLERQELEGKRAEAEHWLRDDWKLRWFTVLADNLDPTRTSELEELRAKYGEPRPPFSSSGIHQIAPTSEISNDDLRKLGMPDLITYLKNWSPPPRDHPEAPSRGGLGVQLGSWASDDPSFFCEHLTSFQDAELHPTYLRSLLDAFTSALREKKEFDAFAVVKAIEWVLANTKAEASGPVNWEEDPGWSWAHMSSARFLSELFLHPEHISVDRHEELWPALELIAQTPSPTSEEETEYRTRSDFGSMALNSARPIGIEAVMRYARWLKMSRTDFEVNAKTLPKVFDLLSKHLDPAIDDSVAVREMFGMQFDLLAWLDREWLKDHLQALFPGKPHKTLDRFAWHSYLRFGSPIPDMLPALSFRYERAINALDPKATNLDDSDRALGNHLMRYIASGTISLDDPMLLQFFAKASPELRAQTVGDVGWHLANQTVPLDAEVQKRLMDFWESRFSAGLDKKTSARQELGAFGWWLSSKKFPDDWAIRQAVAVAEVFRDLRPDFAVVERLAELATAYPYEAAYCLEIVIEEDHEGWAILGWGDNARIIIKEALSGGEKSRVEAIRLINLLVGRGHRGYREMLSDR